MKTRLFIALAAIVLAACGGGGGGGDAPPVPPPVTFADGLGVSGQDSQTVRIGGRSSFPDTPAVAVDDAGRALLVWSEPVLAGQQGFVWQARDVAGRWSEPAMLANLPTFGSFHLRMSPEGDAVLAATMNASRLVRYSPAGGWESTVTTVPFSASFADIAFRPGGAIVMSAVGPAANFSIPAPNSFRALRHHPASGWQTLLESDANGEGASTSAYLATNPDGSAMFFRNERLPSSGAPAYRLRAQELNVDTGLAFGGFPVADSTGRSPEPLVGAASPTNFKVAAFRPCDGGACQLDLARIDVSGIAIRTQRINASGTTVRQTPFLAMSPQGDALAVWMEETPGSPVAPVLWSQSLRGGPWSDPRPVIAPGAGVGGEYISVVIAGNSAGQAAAAARTFLEGREYLAVGRYSAASGWSWRLAANMSEIPIRPAVAIDSAGRGLVVYSGTPCDRVSLSSTGRSVTNCRPSETYALAF